MIKNTGKNRPTGLPNLQLAQTRTTREKVQSERMTPATSVRTERKEAEKTVGFVTADQEPHTERKTNRETVKTKKVSLLRQQSEKSISKIDPDTEKKHNKKEKPSKPLERQKSSKPLFGRKKPPAPEIQSAAKAVMAETRKLERAKPPVGGVNCCRDILRIFKEEQFAHLQERFREHCATKQVKEQCAFLEAIAPYSDDKLPTPEQARELIATYGTWGQPLFLNIENNDPWGAAKEALDAGDMQAFFRVVMGRANEAADDDSSAILPQLAMGLEEKYRPFVKANT